MTRAFRSAAIPFGVCLVLAGCASENGFRPWTAEDEGADPSEDGAGEGQDGQDAPDSGGWGDWQPSSIPDLAIVLAEYNDEGGTDVVVADLRGRILDTWRPPVVPLMGSAPFVEQIHPVGPGEVLVVTGWGSHEPPDTRRGYWNTTNDGPHGTSELRAWVGLTGVWHGDLVHREWTRLMHLDPEEYAYVLDGSGRRLAMGSWKAPWGVQVAPWQGTDDHLLVSWYDGRCEADGGQRVMVVSTGWEGSDQERFWTLDRDWDLPGGNPTRVTTSTGTRADGEAMLLAQASYEDCRGPQQAPPDLVRWRMNGAPEVLGTHPWGWPRPLLHGPSGAVLTVGPHDTDNAWRLSWLGVDDAVGSVFEHNGGVRPVAPLDPEHGAALIALQSDHTIEHELVLIAGGREVWRIDALKQGLGERPIRMITGTVIPVP